MAETVACPNCARACRVDRPDADGRLVCSACATIFLPTSGAERPATISLVSLGDVAIDADETTAPTAVPVATNLGAAGLNVSVTLAPSEATSPTTAVTSRKTVGELLRDGHGDKYVVDTELGRGGMGMVMRVVDRDLHRDVAMKVLLNDQGDRDRRRFITEAQITGQLEHPNIVPVHDIGVDGNGRLYFTMKLVRGRSLGDVIDLVRRGDPSVAEFTRFRLLRIFIHVCNAAAFAHARGVVHRDLKPSNVMLGDFGEVLVADWGLARVLPEHRRASSRERGVQEAEEAAKPADAIAPAAFGDIEDRLATVVQSFRRPASSAQGQETVQGTVEGTPAYMPPEQARGDLDQIDERSDIYALGAILYEILTYSPPVWGRSVDEVLDNVVNHRITPPGARAPEQDIPLDLSAIALKALSAEPEHRYQRAADLRRDIEAHLEHRSVSARDESAVEMLGKLLRRNSTATLVGLISLSILAVVLVVSFRTIQRERDAARQRGAELASSMRQLEEQKQGRGAEKKLAAPALVAKARQHAASKEWVEATDNVELALRFSPELAAAHLLRGQLLVHERQWVAASRSLSEYLQLSPGDEDARQEDARQLAGLCDEAAGGETSMIVTAIADRLVRMGLGPLAEDLFARGLERVEVYRKQLELAYPGCTQRGFWADKDGMLYLDGLRERQDVVDLSPLSGMPIVRLRLQRTKVIDLAPLRGMPLTDLDLSGTEVRDLGPLAGAPLISLNISGTRVEDLAALSGIALEDIDLSQTRISSLQALQGAPLRVLRANRSDVSDIGPLQGAPLHELDLSKTAVSDLSALGGSKISTLRLSGTRVQDLGPLAGVPLTRLAIDGTPVTDLAPLAGAPLRQLQLASCQVAVLKPLTGMALSELDLTGLPVADLSPLAGMPLASLTLTGTGVTDLGPLRRLRITSLNLSNTKVSDLRPLASLPITSLDLAQTPVSELGPLASCPLQSLVLDGIPAEDLKPLAKTPLRELRMLGARATDLTPLADTPLERLVFSMGPGIAGLRQLRTLPTLRQIGTSWEGGWQRVPAAKDFWPRIDGK
jgi:serine/threonine protein kinase/Leucine-rich repeat (LRR) protein